MFFFASRCRPSAFLRRRPCLNWLSRKLCQGRVVGSMVLSGWSHRCDPRSSRGVSNANRHVRSQHWPLQMPSSTRARGVYAPGRIETPAVVRRGVRGGRTNRRRHDPNNLPTAADTRCDRLVGAVSNCRAISDGEMLGEQFAACHGHRRYLRHQRKRVACSYGGSFVRRLGAKPSGRVARDRLEVVSSRSARGRG